MDYTFNFITNTVILNTVHTPGIIKITAGLPMY
jgi:hypothetical protein